MESERKIENHEVFDKTKSDEIITSNLSNGAWNGGNMNHQEDKENEAPNKENINNVIRRHDEPSELSFEICKKIFVVVLLDR